MGTGVQADPLLKTVIWQMFNAEALYGVLNVEGQ